MPKQMTAFHDDYRGGPDETSTLLPDDPAEGKDPPYKVQNPCSLIPLPILIRPVFIYLKGKITLFLTKQFRTCNNGRKTLLLKAVAQGPS